MTLKTENRQLRGLNVQVLYNNTYRKCANGGITERHETVWVVANPKSDVYNMLPTIPGTARNLVVADERGGVIHLRPFEQPSGMCGPMMGGSYAHTPDSRWRTIVGVDYPVAVHDRFETEERMRVLSV